MKSGHNQRRVIGKAIALRDDAQVVCPSCSVRTVVSNYAKWASSEAFSRDYGNDEPGDEGKKKESQKERERP